MPSPTCLCGATKDHPEHLACRACFAAIPKDVRERFLDKARNKRGAPSYWCAVRAVEQSVKDNLSKAKG